MRSSMGGSPAYPRVRGRWRPLKSEVRGRGQLQSVTMRDEFRVSRAIQSDSSGDHPVFIVLQRPARPDARPWPGRRTLACLDALFWPSLVASLLLATPRISGLAGATALAVCGWAAAARLAR